MSLISEVIARKDKKLGFSNFLHRINDQKYLIIMALPAIVLMVLFSYGPMVGIITAFEDYEPVKGFFGSQFIGIENFSTFFNTDMLAKIIINTFGISLFKLIVCFPANIVLALLLNELKNMIFKRTLQTVSYLPHFISWVVAIGLWSKLFANETGLVNIILVHFGLESTAFFSQSWFMWPFAAFSEMWKETGWNAIIYLAAISSIDPQQYEAAVMDGAGRWKQMLHVTLPGIKGTIAILLILAIPNIVNSNTAQLWVLGTLPVRDVTEVIDTYVLRTGIGSSQYGIAAAAGLLKSAVSCVLLIFADRVSKKVTDQGIL